MAHPSKTEADAFGLCEYCNPAAVTAVCLVNDHRACVAHLDRAFRDAFGPLASAQVHVGDLVRGAQVTVARDAFQRAAAMVSRRRRADAGSTRADGAGPRGRRHGLVSGLRRGAPPRGARLARRRGAAVTAAPLGDPVLCRGATCGARTPTTFARRDAVGNATQLPPGWQEVTRTTGDGFRQRLFLHEYGASVEQRADGWVYWRHEDDDMHRASTMEEAFRLAAPADLDGRIVGHVGNCARCGGEHEQLYAFAFDRPPVGVTHWASCPATNDPILVTFGNPSREKAVGGSAWSLLHAWLHTPPVDVPAMADVREATAKWLREHRHLGPLAEGEDLVAQGEA